MKKIILLAICCFWAPGLWAADDSKLPPLPEGLEEVPPPVNFDDIPSLKDLEEPMPKFEGPGPGLPEDAKKEEPEEEQPAPTPTPTPEPSKPEPTPTSVPQEPRATPMPPAAVPMAEEKPAEPAAPPAVPMAEEKPSKSAEKAPARPKAAAPAPQTPAKGDFTDYFPASVGMKWNYEHLSGSGGAKASRSVECISRQEFGNGTVRLELKVTEDGRVFEEKYSLYQSKMEMTFADGKPVGGVLAFKMPPPGGEAAWVEKLPDGTVKDCKASMGKASVFQKTYPHCVIVVKKYKKAGVERVAYSYFAKGIGLLSEEVYDASMKLLHSESIALVKGPSAPGN